MTNYLLNHLLLRVLSLSLLALLPCGILSATSNTIGIEELLQEATDARSQNLEKAVKLSKEVIQLSNQNNLLELKAEAQLLICSMYNSEMNYDSLYQYCQAARLFFEKENNQEKMAWTLQRSGIVEDMLGDRKKAKATFEKSLAIFESLDNKEGIAYCLSDLGVIHTFDGEYIKASKFYIRALRIFENYGNNIGMARVLSSLGFFYKRQSQNRKAEEYFMLALEKAEEANDKYWMGMSLMGLTKMHRQNEKFEEAFQYNERLIQLSQSLKSNYLFLDGRNNQAFLLYDLGRYDESITAAFSALDLMQTQNRKHSKSIIHNLLAKNYIQQNKLNQAFSFLEKVTISPDVSKSDRAIAYSTETLYWEKKGNFQKAFESQRKYIRLKNELSKKERSIAISRLESSYQLGQKQSEINLLNEKNELQEQVLQKRNILLITVVGLSLLVITLLYRNYYFKQQLNKNLESKISERTQDLEKAKTKLEASNEELKKFAHLTSHDLREPLRNIFGFFHLLEKRKSNLTEATTQEYINLAKKNAIQMNNLIEDIVTYTQVHETKEITEMVDLNEVVKEVRLNLNDLIVSKNATIFANNLPTIPAVYSEMYKIFEQLIHNGLKFNQSDAPSIRIESLQNDMEHCISIQDNGIGIEQEYFDKIFEMFGRLHNRAQYEGSGIGLATCKKIIDKYGGKIYVQSNIGENSTFIFTLPKRFSFSNN